MVLHNIERVIFGKQKKAIVETVCHKCWRVILLLSFYNRSHSLNKVGICVCDIYTVQVTHTHTANAVTRQLSTNLLEHTWVVSDTNALPKQCI